MALFGYNYDKPGKGVDPNTPQKAAFFRFWELLKRKFFKYVLFNMMYFVIIMPIVMLVYSAFYGWVASVGTFEKETVLSIVLELFRTIAMHIPKALQLPLLIISLILYGPFTCGMTYILRNYAREEHAWISDFFTKSFENFGQGLFFGILDILATVILLVNLNYTGILGSNTTAMTLFGVFLKYFTIVLYILYFMMRNYFYQMVVTANLKIPAILKNASLFLVLGLWRNIIATVAIAASVFIMLFLHPLLELVTVPLIGFSFCGFIAVFTTYPIIEKYIVKPVLNSEKAEEEADLEAKLAGRGGELPPELGGPGAGSHDDKPHTDDTSDNA